MGEYKKIDDDYILVYENKSQYENSYYIFGSVYEYIEDDGKILFNKGNNNYTPNHNEAKILFGIHLSQRGVWDARLFFEKAELFFNDELLEINKIASILFNQLVTEIMSAQPDYIFYYDCYYEEWLNEENQKNLIKNN